MHLSVRFCGSHPKSGGARVTGVKPLDHAMRFQRFIDGAVAADGGTSAYRVELDDGSILECGLDARIPKTKAQRVIFVGAGYPTLPGARSFARESAEEQDFVSALQEFINREPTDQLAGCFLQVILVR